MECFFHHFNYFSPYGRLVYALPIPSLCSLVNPLPLLFRIGKRRRLLPPTACRRMTPKATPCGALR